MKQFAVRVSAALGCAALAIAGGQWVAYAQEEATEEAAPEVEPNVSAVEPIAVSDTGKVMSMFVDPNFIKIQEGLATEPDRRGWRTVRESALAVAESTNLFFLYVPAEGGDEWKQMTVESRVAAYELMKSAKATDYEGTKAKYMALIESCNKCHQRFDPDAAPKIEP